MNLPKGYISWSQLNLWETNKQKYIEHYFEGKPTYQNKEMRFGSWFHEQVEAQKSDDPLTNQIIRMLARRKFTEGELDVASAGIPLKVIFDSVDKDGFEEYKTGKTPWTRQKVDSHGQMDFGALAFKADFGFIPDMALHWLPTKEDDGIITLTGEIHTWIVTKTQADLDRMQARIIKAVEEISDYKKHAKKIVKI